MPVYRVMTQVRAPADEPPRERRVRAVEHGVERRFPMNAPRLVAPECLGVLDRTAVEVAVAGHLRRSFGCWVTNRWRGRALRPCWAAPERGVWHKHRVRAARRTTGDHHERRAQK